MTEAPPSWLNPTEPVDPIPHHNEADTNAPTAPDQSAQKPSVDKHATVKADRTARVGAVRTHDMGRGPRDIRGAHPEGDF